MIYFLYPLQSILNLDHCCLDSLGIGRTHLYVHKSTDNRSCRRHDRMVVGFTTTCAISAYHH